MFYKIWLYWLSPQKFFKNKKPSYEIYDYTCKNYCTLSLLFAQSYQTKELEAVHSPNLYFLINLLTVW